MSEAALPLIERFLTDSGMSASYFGKKAVNNSEVVARLRAGREILPSTQKALLDFIGAERQRRNLPDTSAEALDEEHHPAAPPGRELAASTPHP